MSKFAIILSTEALANLANHNDKQDVNASHAYHRDRLRDQLNKTDQNVFFLISQHSVKYFGVSYMSNATMGKKLECSPRTVQRSVAKLAKLGAIEVFAARRKTGDKRQTANVLRLVRRPAEDCRAECHTKSVTPIDSLLNPKTNKDLKTFEAKPTEQAPAVASVTKQELAEAYDIPAEVIYATNAVRLSDRKFVELFANNGAVLRDALFKRTTDDALTPLLVRWELNNPVYLACLKSAAIRTAYVAKQRPIRNITAYFIATYCDLVIKEMQAIEAIAV
ncbi:MULTISPECIES: helix-turn-helix domain-containing protein [unclassified Exiguobacterium]|uniref:helix-turn-helix domain-containing protein n=1 Tax=unclassified Exiguobacterium TaxID=2644629 RepID=UPI001BEA4D74|nr:MULTISPECIES: helix-turn-helix domain-containing protein [unclassified Exiguobacterium]